MRKLIESTHVALSSQADPLDWAYPYLDDEHTRYATVISGDVAGFVADLKRQRAAIS